MIPIDLPANLKDKESYQLTVADNLTVSRLFHDAYRKLGNKYPKPDGWQLMLEDALTYRKRAHALDPQHADAAWSDDPPYAPHEALMAFYERQLRLLN